MITSAVGAGTAVHGLDSIWFQRVSLMLVNKTTGEETHHMIKSAALLHSEPVMEKIVGESQEIKLPAILHSAATVRALRVKLSGWIQALRKVNNNCSLPRDSADARRAVNHIMFQNIVAL